MIDAVDLRFIEDAEDNFVQLLGGGKITAKGFFDDNARPRIRRAGLGEAGEAELLDDLRIDFGRRGKIKQAVAAQLFGGFQLFQVLGQLSEIVGISIFAGVILEIGGEVAPLLEINRADLGHGLSGFAERGTKTLVGHWRARKAYDGVFRAERVMVGQVIHGGNYFALGEIARRSE